MSKKHKYPLLKNKPALIGAVSFAIVIALSFFGLTTNAEKSESENALMATLGLVITVGQDGGVREPSNNINDMLNGQNICPANPTAGCDFDNNDGVVRTNDGVVYNYNYNVIGSSENVTLTAIAPNGTVWSDLPGFCVLPGSSISADKKTIVCNRGVRPDGFSESVPFTAIVESDTAHNTVLTASGSVSGPMSTTTNDTSPNVSVTAAPRFNIRKSFTGAVPITVLGVEGFRVEFRALIEVHDDVALNPTIGNAPLESPFTFTDDISGISPNAKLHSCSVKDNHGGDAGSINCVESASQVITATITGADTSLDQYTSPPGNKRYLIGTYRIRLFIPNSDVQAASGSLSVNNTFTDFDPDSTDQISNFVGNNERTSDNTASTELSLFGGTFGKRYVRSVDSDDIFTNTSEFVAPEETFATRVTFKNNSVSSLNNLVLCDVFDNASVSVDEISSGVVHSYRVNSNNIAPTKVEFAAGYVTPNWGTATLPNDSSIKTECGDAGITWYTDPSQVPGGYAAITKFRMVWDSLASGKSGRGWVKLKARDTNFATGTTLPTGTVMPNVGTYRSDELNPNYITNNYNPNLYPFAEEGGISRGDRVILSRAIARVAKETENNDSVNTIVSGDDIGYVLKPALTSSEPGQPALVTLTDVLPVGLTYLAGTGKQSGSLFEPTITYCTGNNAPSSRCTANGQQILFWNLGALAQNVAIPEISFRALADLSIANNQTVTNSVIIDSPADPSPETARTAERAVTGTVPSAMLLAKNVTPSQIEKNQNFSYIVSYSNTRSSSSLNGIDIIDILPYNGDASINFGGNTHTRTPATNFSGTRKVTGLSSSSTGTWYFTNAVATTLNLDPSIASNQNPGTVGSIWCAGTNTGPSVGCGFTLAQATGIRFLDSQQLPNDGTVKTLTYNYSTNGNTASDVYTNNVGGIADELILAVKSNNVSVVVADSSIAGTLWYDTNGDGIRNAAEVGRIAMQTVRIRGTDVNNATIDDTVQTDANGNYVFDSLISGQYTIEFPSQATYLNSPKDAGVDNSSDSDGDSSTLKTDSINLGVNSSITNVDQGYLRGGISGTVWNDANNDGQFASENIVTGITVRLYNSAGNEIIVGDDGILGTADDATGGIETGASGNYSFQGLSSGSYRVVVSPNGSPSSTPTNTDPNTNIDNDDNGFPDNTGDFAGRIISGIITFVPGSPGAASNNTPHHSDGTSSDSTIDFGLILSPTSVKLEKFEAFYDNGTVLIEWSTGDEVNNLGFNVYRETNGQRTLVTSAPIAGNVLKSKANLAISADNYTWRDSNAGSGSVYYLEDIDTDGTITTHGPISPNYKLTYDLPKQNSLLLNDLATANSLNKQIDSVSSTSNVYSKTIDLIREDLTGKDRIKISVKKDGIYHVSNETLQNEGFDTNENSANWKLFTDGVEVPILVNRDGSIEFFGRIIESLYSNTQVYYLVNDDSAGKRVSTIKGGDADERTNAVSFENRAIYKDPSIYVSSILNGENNNWFGSIIYPNSQTTQDLQVYNLDLDSNKPARLRIRLQGVTKTKHFVNVIFNDYQVGVVNLSDRENKEFELDIPVSEILEGTNQVSLQSAGVTYDLNLVDTIELSYQRKYIARDNKLHLSLPAGQTAEVQGFSTGKIRVFEIRNQVISNEIEVDFKQDATDSYSFELGSATYKRELIAIPDDQFAQVDSTEFIFPSNLKASSNQADFVIIAPNALKTSAYKLAKVRTDQGLLTKVVAAEDIYDEFSYGKLSPKAIRTFLQTATKSWERKPKYVLLFGDSSYDSKNYLGNNRQLIPTKLFDSEFMETASDAWFTDFDDDGIENIAIGRIPVKTALEANKILAKLARYDAQRVSEQKSSLFVADNGFNSLNEDIVARLPQTIAVTSLNRNELSDSELNESIIAQINENPTLVTYTGHGSTSVWASRGVFSLSDVNSLNNDQLSVYLLMTCLNGLTHGATYESLSEALFKAQNGAIAVWASSGTTFSKHSNKIGKATSEIIFNSSDNSHRIGDIIIKAKSATDNLDVRRTWILIGDPTIPIK